MVDKKIEDEERIGAGLSTSTKILANLARRQQQQNLGTIKSRGSGRFASSRQGTGPDPLAKFSGLTASIGTARSLAAAEGSRIAREKSDEEERLDRLAATETRESNIANVRSQIDRRLGQTAGEDEARNLQLARDEEGVRQFNIREERLGAGAGATEALQQLQISQAEIGIAKSLNLPIKKESRVGKSVGLLGDVPAGKLDLTRREKAQIETIRSSVDDIRIKQEDFKELTADDEIRLLNAANDERAIVGLPPLPPANGELSPEGSPAPVAAPTPIAEDQRGIIKQALIDDRKKRLGL